MVRQTRDARVRVVIEMYVDRYLEAERRAASLLNEFLSPKQRASLAKYGCFSVRAQSGRSYRLHNRRAYNVQRGILAYCVGFKDSTVPLADVLLMQVLMLKTNEEALLKAANVTVVSYRLLIALFLVMAVSSVLSVRFGFPGSTLSGIALALAVITALWALAVWCMLRLDRMDRML